METSIMAVLETDYQLRLNVLAERLGYSPSRPAEFVEFIVAFDKLVTSGKINRHLVVSDDDGQVLGNFNTILDIPNVLRNPSDGALVAPKLDNIVIWVTRVI